MTSHQIRQNFIKFFVKHGHHSYSSSSLIPSDDSTVLFTVAGMQQFKPYFTGKKDPIKDFKAKRLTTIQKCFRTADIDLIGDTTHLTLFEMLGNFSFGDYGKAKAIDLSWEFFTKELHLDAKKLWVTIYAGDDKVGRDKEAEKIWLKHVPQNRIAANGKADNWWGPPGKTGPCGPCSEIHYQLTDQPSGQPGGDSTDFLELWNLVFMEYNQDEHGKLTELPQKNIDTGAGLERIAMIVQHIDNLFDSDIYEPVIAAIKKLPAFGRSDEEMINDRRIRIVADHLRGACFLIADGVRFSNKDQGYILRRIVRRAADQFIQFDFNFDTVIEVIINHFGDFYPELKTQHHEIIKLLNDELNQYRKVLNIDVTTLVKKLRQIKTHELSAVDQMSGLSHQKLSADEVFNLFTSHGITLDRLERLGFVFDRKAVESKLIEHQEISRAGAGKKFGGHGLNDDAGLTDEQKAVMVKYHTTTHLLQAALRQILGSEVKQSGSDINPERVRFDFSFSRKLTDEEKQLVEDLVNAKIKENIPVTSATMSYQAAIDSGALAFFKEKYGDDVTVYTIGDFSKELCGGPHVKSTGEIGHFKITTEQSVGSGLRRIKAVV